MNQYEVTFIVDPVLSGDEIKATAQAYQDMIVNEGLQMVNVDEMGLKQLAYPINKRNSGIYYCLEFNGESGTVISKMELALRRDERIMRYLTVKLDKYGVKYNEDKRNGLIGKMRTSESRDEAPAAKKAKEAAPKKTKAAPTPAPSLPVAKAASSEEE